MSTQLEKLWKAMNANKKWISIVCRNVQQVKINKLNLLETNQLIIADISTVYESFVVLNLVTICCYTIDCFVNIRSAMPTCTLFYFVLRCIECSAPQCLVDHSQSSVAKPQGWEAPSFKKIITMQACRLTS